jgi:hypothetical protein
MNSEMPKDIEKLGIYWASNGEKLERTLSNFVRALIPNFILCCVLVFTSCRRTPTPPAAPADGSVAQRITDLEKYVEGNSPRPSDEELRKEAEHDLAEIRSMGLVDRAQRDFNSRVAGAAIDSFGISYFKDTNLVWCHVSYKTRSSNEPNDQYFGYKRAEGTNWNLIWEEQKTK